MFGGMWRGKKKKRTEKQKKPTTKTPWEKVNQQQLKKHNSRQTLTDDGVYMAGQEDKRKDGLVTYTNYIGYHGRDKHVVQLDVLVLQNVL